MRVPQPSASSTRFIAARVLLVGLGARRELDPYEHALLVFDADRDAGAARRREGARLREHRGVRWRR